MDTYRLNNKPISWAMRQKWAKQITRGVAAFHERGQVVGGMRTYNWCVCVNEHDDAVIMSLTYCNHPAIHDSCGLLPPECRTEAFAKGDGQLEPEFDIFQLGGLLWHLYRNQNGRTSGTFCSLSGCSNTSSNAISTQIQSVCRKLRQMSRSI
jgi:hypothetical protein